MLKDVTCSSKSQVGIRSQKLMYPCSHDEYLLVTLGVSQLAPITTFISRSVQEDNAGLGAVHDTESCLRHLSTGPVAELHAATRALDDSVVESPFQHEIVVLSAFVESLQGVTRKAAEDIADPSFCDV